MILGIVSDTHGMMEMTRRALRIFECFDVEEIIHCGDIGTASVVELFQRWPTHFVFGNCDDPISLTRAIDRAGKTCHDRFGSLDHGERRIAFLHGDDGDRFQHEVASGRWDLVCYGHTHEARFQSVGRTLTLNPGALSRSLNPSVAVVELPGLNVTTIPV